MTFSRIRRAMATALLLVMLGTVPIFVGAQAPSKSGSQGAKPTSSVCKPMKQKVMRHKSRYHKKGMRKHYRRSCRCKCGMSCKCGRMRHARSKAKAHHRAKAKVCVPSKMAK